MEEVFAEKAIALWGPFAMVVLLLISGLIILGRQYLKREKAYEERDEKRLAMFMEATAEFSLQTAESRKSVYENTIITRELKDLLGDVHTLMIKINERL